jgi:hypothetical protein
MRREPMGDYLSYVERYALSFTIEANETYYRGRRDLLYRQKRPTTLNGMPFRLHRILSDRAASGPYMQVWMA